MLEANSQNELLSPSQNLLEPPFQNSPEQSREQPRQDRSGLRTGAIICLILLLIVVFVIGGFARWVYAGTKSSSLGSTLNATTLDTLRESVAAKLRPTVVQINHTWSKLPIHILVVAVAETTQCKRASQADFAAFMLS